MLEKVKPGDLCVFSNGEQARVTKVEITPTKNYDLHFDKPVLAKTEGSRYCSWVYECTGILILSHLTGNKYINIVKLIAE